MSNGAMTLRRVFISYSHEDSGLAEKVCAVIKSLGMEVSWDGGFAYGRGFDEQIKMCISHAHIFLPLITESSSNRGWVHQEIGYAVALNIPVLPVAWGRFPHEMLDKLHAIVLPESEREHETVLTEKLTRRSVDALLDGYQDEADASYQAAPFAEDRALLMAHHANQLAQLGKTATLRQKGGLSSLHIPRSVITHRVWRERYGCIPENANSQTAADDQAAHKKHKNSPKSPYHCRYLRNERLVLEHHAREAGFKIIIDPSITYAAYGPAARRARLLTLIDFLTSLDDDPKYQVATCKRIDLTESITILGTWFYAQSVSAALRTGYRQTIFTCHAPSMQSKIDVFDCEFAGILADRKPAWKPEESRLRAIEELESKVAKIDEKMKDDEQTASEPKSN
jgi:TIR domain